MANHKPSADQIRRAFLNSKQQPINNSARIKRALDNHQVEKVKFKEVQHGEF